MSSPLPRKRTQNGTTLMRVSVVLRPGQEKERECEEEEREWQEREWEEDEG